MDYKLNYDNEASGPFSEGEILTFGGGGTAELVLLYDDGATGEMYVNMISGSAPLDNETISGGTSAATADVDGNSFLSRFPGKIRGDISYDSTTGNIRWTGPALGTTHSCLYDGEAGGPFTVGEILTFGNGSTAELIALTDNGADGELFVRMIGVALPPDNDTITGGSSGATAAVNGAFHIRAYTPNNLHYWFLDKGDDATSVGDDDQDRTKPRVSTRVGVTDVTFLGLANIDDTVSYHMYGGSVQQNTGDDEYNAITISVVDADGQTEPVSIRENALRSDTTTEYWKNAYMPDAASRVNILIKVKAGGTVTDGRRVRFRALEYLRQYFTAPDPTLSGGITPVSLVATDDGNNTTAAATVATWTDAVFTYGYALIDHNNGAGPKPFWAVGDTGSRTKGEFHERQKWVQRRGTAETIYGINAQLIVGNDLDVPYDTESGAGFTEGEIITFSNGCTALLLGLNDQGLAGTLYCQRLTGVAPSDGATMTGGTSSTTAAVNGTPETRLIINNLAGNYTGAAFNPGNNGVTLEAADADSADLFFALDGTQQKPPNNQTGTVNTDTGNIITIYPWDGTSTDTVGDPEPDFTRLVLSTALTGSTTSVVVGQTIPTWAPTTGFLRITLNSGSRRLVPYTSYSGSTFTIPSTDFSGDNASISNGVMPAPADNAVVGGIEQFTGVYTANQNKAGTGDQQFVIDVSNGSGPIPKQPSPNTATFGSGGFALNVTLQDD